MQEFNKDLLFNFSPTLDILNKTIGVTEKLGKLNVRMKDTFIDYKRASRIFAFIESKYSSKIEGIYTTLFDVVNTGAETNKQKLIKPLVNELLSTKKQLSVDRLKELSDMVNTGIDASKRYDDSFGIYKTVDNKKKKIYEPPKNEKEVGLLLKDVISKSEKDEYFYNAFHTHIMFEKVHPFIDANGRLGRLILQKQVARLMNFSNVIPLSWAFFTNLSQYYEAFDIETKSDLEKGISLLLDIFEKMYITTKKFLTEVSEWSRGKIDIVKTTSNKVTDEIALDILLSIQTKRIDIERKYGLNPRTIDAIFGKLNEDISFNFKKANRNVLYWNIELEQIIENHFKG